MPLDLKDFYEQNRAYYGNVPLDKVATQLYEGEGGAKTGQPYEEWTKTTGLRDQILDDNYQREVEKARQSTPGILGELGRSLGRGFTQTVPEQIGKGLQWMNVEGGPEAITSAGKSLESLGEENKKRFPGLTMSKAAEEASDWNPRKWVASAGESIAQSVTPLIVGGAAAALTGGNPIVGAAAGIGMLAEMFYGGTAEDTYRDARKKGLDHQDAKDLANITGGVEAGGELVADLIPIPIFRGLGKAAKGTVMKTLTARSMTPKAMLSSVLETIAGEELTESGQQAAQTYAAQRYGVADQSVLDSVKEVWGPTLVTSLMFGAGGIGYNTKHRSDVRKALADPTMPVADRLKAVQEIAGAANEVNPSVSKGFYKTALKLLADEKPIIIDDDSFYEGVSRRENLDSPPPVMPGTLPSPGLPPGPPAGPIANALKAVQPLADQGVDILPTSGEETQASGPTPWEKLISGANPEDIDFGGIRPAPPPEGPTKPGGSGLRDMGVTQLPDVPPDAPPESKDEISLTWFEKAKKGIQSDIDKLAKEHSESDDIARKKQIAIEITSKRIMIHDIDADIKAVDAKMQQADTEPRGKRGIDPEVKSRIDALTAASPIEELESVADLLGIPKVGRDEKGRSRTRGMLMQEIIDRADQETMVNAEDAKMKAADLESRGKRGLLKEVSPDAESKEAETEAVLGETPGAIIPEPAVALDEAPPKTIKTAITEERPGMPVEISELRKKLPDMAKADFDKEMLDLHNSGEYFMTRNAKPLDSLTDSEKEDMIPAGDGNYFMAINPRDVAKEPVAPVGIDQADQPNIEIVTPDLETINPAPPLPDHIEKLLAGRKGSENEKRNKVELTGDDARNLTMSIINNDSLPLDHKHEQLKRITSGGVITGSEYGWGLGELDKAEIAKPAATPLQYDPTTDLHNGEKLVPGDILKDKDGNTYKLDRNSGFMLSVDQISNEGKPIGMKSFSVDPMDKDRYHELFKQGAAPPTESSPMPVVEPPAKILSPPKAPIGPKSMGEAKPVVDQKAPVGDTQKIKINRTTEIKSELESLQKKYEKKSKSMGAMVPPAIKSDALKSITKQMDKLNSELKSINKGQKANTEDSGVELSSDISNRKPLDLQKTRDRMPFASKKLSDVVQGTTLLDTIDYLLDIKSKPQTAVDPSDLIQSNASSQKSHFESMAADIKLLRDTIGGDTFSQHGFSGLDVETQGRVKASMLRLVNDQKILDAVVKFVPVDVMDNLRNQKLTPNVFFHDPSMIADSFSQNLGNGISVGRNMSDSLISALAISGAIEVSGLRVGDLIGPSQDGFLASATFNLDHAVTSFINRYDNTRHLRENQKKSEKTKFTYGANNKIFTEDRANKARDILRKKLGQVSSGLDPELLSAGVDLAGYHVEAGARKFADYAKAMISDLGDSVRPFLKSFYNAVRDYPGLDSNGMDSYDKVKELDVNSIESEGRNGQDDGSISGAGNSQRGKLDEARQGIFPPMEGSGPISDQDVSSSESGSGDRGGKDEIRPGSKQVAGQQATGGTVEESPRSRADTVVSTPTVSDIGQDRSSMGQANYSLTDATPISLTKGQRKTINGQVRTLVDRGGPFTDDEKNTLRQYTGEGGLGSGQKESLNQHFTDYPTISAIYRAIENSGFKFKKALEPSAGSGNFVGMRSGADWTTVDIDKTNHEVLKALYPDARHYLTSFENLKTEGFDLITSNVPFLEQRGADAVKNRPDIKALHDFYFVHAISLVKDNGMVAFITSRGTMDKKGRDTRSEIVSKADILAAYRLPGGHFEKNAHTSVIADIIFMQKRPEGAIPSDAQKAINDSFINASETKDGVVLNEYYHNRMDNILGEVSIGKDKARFGKETYNISQPAALERMAFNYAPYDTSAKAPEVSSSDLDAQAPPTDSQAFLQWADTTSTPYKISAITSTDSRGNSHTSNPSEGFSQNIFIQNDSRVMVFDRSVEFTDVDGRAKIYKDADLSEARKIIKLQRIASDISSFQTYNDAMAQDRATRNISAYQEEFKVHPGQDRALKALFNSVKEKTFFAELSTLFKEDFGVPDSLSIKTRHIGSGRASITADTPLKIRAFAAEDNKGIIASKIGNMLSNKDMLDLLDNGYSAVSERDGSLTLQNDILYYSGNVYQKIKDASDLKANTQNLLIIEKLNQQIESLEAIKPEPKTLDEINFKGGENWSMPVLQRAGLRIDTQIDSKGMRSFVYPNSRIYEKYLNNQQLINKEQDEATYSFMSRMREAEDMIWEENSRLKSIIKQNDALAKALERGYNSRFRNYVKPEYDKAEYLVADVLREIEKSPIKLRENQVRWLVQAVYEGKGINAHDVGGGKTFAAIALARALKNRGVAKKPLFVVPAKTIKKWHRDIKTLFPDAVVVDLGKLSATERQRQLFNLSHTNADYILVSHEGFAHLQLPLDKELGYIDAILTEHVDDPSATGREAAKIDDDIQTLKRIISETPRDTRLTFDKLGIDMIVADEAHNYKNIAMRGSLVRFGLGTSFAINSKSGPVYKIQEMDNGRISIIHPETNEVMGLRNGYSTVDVAKAAIRKLPSIPGTAAMKSSRSYDFRFKTNYITDNNNGNNVFLLTATPTPNKPMEVYTMLRHLSPSIFHEYGINNDVDFSNSFFQLGTVENPIKNIPVNILKAIVNANELRGILNRYVDKISMENMPWIKVPEEDTVRHFLSSSPGYRVIAEDLKERQANLPKPPGEGDDTVISIYTSGRAASIDPRLYGGSHANVSIDDRSFDSDTDKIQFVIDEASKVFKANKSAGQLIFLDAAGFQQVERGALSESLHSEIKRLLVAEGSFKTEQIAIINGKVITDSRSGREFGSGDKDQRKQDIADAYNAGKIKVIIGSTTSMGEGMDLQVHTTDIWHLDIPFTPGAIRQRIGRGVRFGNKNDTVKTHYLLMKGTFDAMSLDLVIKKTGWNEAVWDKEASDTISTEEEMIGGAIPQREQILIELEPDPATKARMMIGFHGNQLNKQRGQSIEAEYRIRTRLEKISATKPVFEKNLLERQQKLQNLALNMEIKNKEKRAEAFEKSKSSLKRNIEASKRNIADVDLKLSELSKKLATATEEKNIINDKVLDFSRTFFDQKEGTVIVPSWFDVDNPKYSASALAATETPVADILFSDANTTTKRLGLGKVTAAQVKAEFKPLIDNLNDKGDVSLNIESDPSKITDEGLRRAVIAYEQKTGRLVRGFFHKKTGTLYVFTDRMGSMKEAAQVIAHELFGHFGLYEFLGPELQPFLDFISSHPKYGAQVRQTAKERRIDMITQEGRDRAAKEWFAELVEKGDIEPSLWSRFVVAFKNALRKMGFKAEFLVGFSDANIAEIIRGAKSAAEGKFSSAKKESLGIKGDSNSSFRYPDEFSNFRSASAFLKKLDGDVNRPLSSPSGSEIKGLSSSGKSLANSSLVYAKFLSDLSASEAFKKHGIGGLDIETQRLVKSAVVNVIGEEEIFNSVIKSIPIDVVNNFRRSELSPDLLLHNKPMNQNLLTSKGKRQIPISIDEANSLVAITARAATERMGLTSDVRWESLEGLATKAALNDHAVPPLWVSKKPNIEVSDSNVNRKNLKKTMPTSVEADPTIDYSSSPAGVQNQINAAPFTGRTNRVVAQLKVWAAKNGVDKKLGWMERYFVDQDAPLTDVQKTLGAQNESSDYELMHRALGKRLAEAVKLFNRDRRLPILADMAKAKVTHEDVQSLLHAQHAEERNLQMKRINARGFIDSVLKWMGDAEKAKWKEEIARIGEEFKDSGLFNNDRSINDRRDDYVALMDELSEMISEMQEEDYAALDARQEALNDRVYTDKELEKGTPERLQKTLDNARMGLEQRIKLSEKWEDVKDRLSGMTNAEADKIKAKWSGNSAMQKIAAAIRKINADALELGLESGDISQEEYDAMNSAYSMHVPLMREGFPDDKSPTGVIGYGPLGKPYKIAAGSTRGVVDIFANVVDRYHAALTRSFKLEAGRTLYEMVKENPGENWEIIPVPKAPRLDNEGNLRYYPSREEKDNQFEVKVDGVKYLIEVPFEDESMMHWIEAVKRVPADLGPVMRASQRICQLLASLNTSLSLEFVATNFGKDFQVAMIHLETLGVKGIRKDVINGLKGAIRGIYQAERGNEKSEWAKIYRDAAAHGAKIGWKDTYENVAELGKTLQKDLEYAEGKHPWKDKGKKLLSFIEALNTAVENGVRVATYKALIDSGMSKMKAGQIVSNLTVDFTRHGTAGPGINALWMFANAGIQSSARAYQALKIPKVRKIVGGIIAFGALCNVLGAAAGGGDDDGESYYDKLKHSDPDMFERNMVFMLPGGNGKYIKIPMPYVYNTFFVLGNEIAGVMRGRNVVDGMGRIMSALIGSLNPLASSTLAQTVTPTILDPIIQISQNKAWHGGPLMPEKNPFGIPVPESERYFTSVNPIIKGVAQAMNAITGGSKYESGIVSVSPEVLEMLFETFTGSAGRIAKDAFSLPFAIFSEEGLKPNKVPFTRKVLGQIEDRTENTIYKENNDKVDVYRKKLKEASGDERDDLRKDPMSEMLSIHKTTESHLLKLRKMIKLAEKNEKSDRVKELKEEMLALKTKYNTHFHKTQS